MNNRGRRRGGVALSVVIALVAVVMVPSPAHAATSPTARRGPAMAADPATGTVLMFGGLDEATSDENDETWTWDGTAWGYRTSSPAPRRGASSAYDGARRRVLVFGGERGSGHFNETNETWSWDGVAGQWAQETTILGATPPDRTGASMAYDAVTGTVVLFGGYAEPGSLTNPDPGGTRGDTWLWDGATGTWSAQTPAVSPPARSGASMAFDPVRGKVLLFGGTEQSDTWSWDGVARTWTRETPAVSPPPVRGAVMSEHARSGKVVLFGGTLLGGALPRSESAATWTWDGATGNWTRETPRLSPGARAWAAMAYHAGSGTAVLYGGSQGPYGLALGDTWLWDGSGWSRGVRPALTVGDVAVVEGDEGVRHAVFTVSLSEPAPNGVSVDYTTRGDNRELAMVSGSLFFPTGATSRSVKVPVWGDAEDEPDHRFELSLSAALGATVYDRSGIGTILDNDPPPAGVRVGVGDAGLHEGDAGPRAVLFAVTLSRSSSNTVVVSYATAAGSAGDPSDFKARSGTLTFHPGVTSLIVKVPVVPDTLREGDETFSLNLSGPSGAKLGRATGVGTVVDDE